MLFTSIDSNIVDVFTKHKEGIESLEKSTGTEYLQVETNYGAAHPMQPTSFQLGYLPLSHSMIFNVCSFYDILTFL